MNKEIIFSLINALKTLKDIMINHNKTFRSYLDARSIFMINRILYQGERFKKITENINLLMEKVFKENNSREIVQYFKLKKTKSNLITK